MKKNDYEALIGQDGVRLDARKQRERAAGLEDAAKNLETLGRMAEEQRQEAESEGRAPARGEADVPPSSEGAPPGRASE